MSRPVLETVSVPLTPPEKRILAILWTGAHTYIRVNVGRNGGRFVPEPAVKWCKSCGAPDCTVHNGT